MGVSKNKKQKVFAKNQYRCVVCGFNEDLTVDHIKPKSAGGTDANWNLQTMCKGCNQNKEGINRPYRHTKEKLDSDPMRGGPDWY